MVTYSQTAPLRLAICEGTRMAKRAGNACLLSPPNLNGWSTNDKTHHPELAAHQ